MSRLLPLFPLQLVALPGAAIPLHIFEERYREMVGEAEANGTEFGIVLAKDGGVVNAGCTVTVETVTERFPDGSFNVITRGQRRFLLLALNHEKAYLRGEVEYFDDDEWTPVTPALREQALHLWQSVANQSESSGPDPRHPMLSFQLAQAVEDLDFKTVLLRSRSEADRLRQFVEFAQAWIPRQEYVARMKAVAPTNGTSHKPVNLS